MPTEASRPTPITAVLELVGFPWQQLPDSRNRVATDVGGHVDVD